MSPPGFLLLLAFLPALFHSGLAVSNGQYVQDMAKFPYLARYSSNSPVFVACTASIISRRHVITAAHCFRPNGVTRRGFNDNIKPGRFYNLTDITPTLTGSIQVGQPDVRSANTLTVNVTKIAVPTGYPYPNGYPGSTAFLQAFVNNNPQAWERDFVILELAEELTFSSTVKPVKLLNEKSFKKLPGTVEALMIGWGGNDTNRLKYGNWKLSNNEVCSFGAVYYYYFWLNYKNLTGNPMSVDTLGQVQQNMSLALEDGLVCGTPNPSGMEGGNSGGPGVVISPTGIAYQIGTISNNYDVTVSSYRAFAFIFSRVSASCQYIESLTNVKCHDFK